MSTYHFLGLHLALLRCPNAVVSAAFGVTLSPVGLAPPPLMKVRPSCGFLKYTQREAVRMSQLWLSIMAAYYHNQIAPTVLIGFDVYYLWDGAAYCKQPAGHNKSRTASKLWWVNARIHMCYEHIGGEWRAGRALVHGAVCAWGPSQSKLSPCVM